jgi:hypothetical protein
MSEDAKAIVLFLVFSAYTLLVGFVMYRKGGKDAVGLCADCNEYIEHDGLCHDCRARLWGEHSQ